MDDSLRINGVRHDRMYITKPLLEAGEVAFFEGDAMKDRVLEQKCFIEAVQGQGKLTVLPEQAAVVTRILEAIYESAKPAVPFISTEQNDLKRSCFYFCRNWDGVPISAQLED